MGAFDNPEFSSTSSSSRSQYDPNSTHVNLSDSTSTTSSALLSSVRAQRLAREEARKRERSAVVIQRYWRGHNGGIDAREQAEAALQSTDAFNVGESARKLVGVMRLGRKTSNGGTRRRDLFAGWCEEAGKVVDGKSTARLTPSCTYASASITACLDSISKPMIPWRYRMSSLITGHPRFLDVLSPPSRMAGEMDTDSENRWDYPSYVILGILGSHILDMAVEAPTWVDIAQARLMMQEPHNLVDS